MFIWKIGRRKEIREKCWEMNELRKGTIASQEIYSNLNDVYSN